MLHITTKTGNCTPLDGIPTMINSRVSNRINPMLDIRIPPEKCIVKDEFILSHVSVVDDLEFDINHPHKSVSLPFRNPSDIQNKIHGAEQYGFLDSLIPYCDVSKCSLINDKVLTDKFTLFSSKTSHLIRRGYLHTSCHHYIQLLILFNTSSTPTHWYSLLRKITSIT